MAVQPYLDLLPLLSLNKSLRESSFTIEMYDPLTGMRNTLVFYIYTYTNALSYKYRHVYYAGIILRTIGRENNQLE